MNKKTNDDLLDVTMKRLEGKEIDVATAAVILGVTERQVYRLKNLWRISQSQSGSRRKTRPTNFWRKGSSNYTKQNTGASPMCTSTKNWEAKRASRST